MSAIAQLSGKSSHYSKQVLWEIWISSSDSNRAELFIDSRAAAQMAGVTQRTIRLWIECGSISAIPIGKKLRIYAASLKQFLKNHALDDHH
jgi:excisionase family DNA binding protein